VAKSAFNITVMKQFSFLFATLILATSSLLAQSPCVDGMAGGYPCDNIDLLSVLPSSALGGGDMNDIWGWVDPQDGKEYVILGRTNGTSFIDISDPINPIYLGNLAPSGSNSIWRDIKVDGNYAYIVSEASGHGMQIFDLTKLGAVTSPPVTFSEDAHYSGWGNAHNIVINEASDRAYGVGTNTSSGGLHIVDISDPLNPFIIGDFAGDGYTHDAQVVNYIGPDVSYAGREIAFACNENSVTIIDVTDPTDATQLSRTTYKNSQYTHQGWLTEDHKYFLSNDELDEMNAGVNTTTFIWDVQNLDAPSLIGTFVSSTPAIDHNLYVKDNLCYQSNYRAGLRITNLDDIANGNLTEVAYFDLYPSSDAANFNGTWSNYPYFPSGVVAVSHIEDGLFLLMPNMSNFQLSVADDFICYDEAAVFTVSANDLDSYDSLEFGGDVPGTSTTTNNSDGSVSIVFTDLPQGPIQTYTFTATAYLAGAQAESLSIQVTVYDCDNEVLGCTDAGALNFNDQATIDDGSCTYPCSDVTVTILTDNYPGETTWSISNEEGAVVLSGGPYPESGTEYSVTACLEVGCYDMVINDSYGDGICCAYGTGNYAVSSLGNTLVSGGEFSSSETSNFCVIPNVDDTPGCTDQNACNFNSEATVDNGTCDYGVAAYVDEDGDGFGFGTAMIMTVCLPFPPGISTNNSDCDDSLDTVYPGAPGTGEGLDNNCDSVIDGDELVPCTGDVNGDGSITVADILVILSEFGCTINCDADVDGDGAVTVSDVLVVLSLFGGQC